MRFFKPARAAYVVLLLWEIIKTSLLSRRAFAQAQSGALGLLELFECASLAALCLVPAMYFMLAANEKAFAFCLPLIMIAKGLSLLAFALLAARAAAIYLAILQVSNLNSLFYAIIACAAGDLASFIFCLLRRRKICG